MPCCIRRGVTPASFASESASRRCRGLRGRPLRALRISRAATRLFRYNGLSKSFRIVNRTEVNNGITVPEAAVSYKEQRQAGKSGRQAAYPAHTARSAEVQ